jgi:hypothetical protein
MAEKDSKKNGGKDNQAEKAKPLPPPQAPSFKWVTKSDTGSAVEPGIVVKEEN